MHDVGIPQSFIRELVTLSRCKHPNIISLYDVKIDYLQDVYETKMPLADCDLAVLTPIKIANVLGDIARALYYLEGENILYADLKPSNILLFSGKAVLADFGMLKLEVNDRYFPWETSSDNWKSPEEYAYLLRSPGDNVIRNFKMLSWTFGMLIYYLFHRLNPLEFFTDVNEQICFLVSSLNTANENCYLMDIFQRSCFLERGRDRLLVVEEKFYDDILEDCLQFNPDKRISMYEICFRLGLKAERDRERKQKLCKNEIKLEKPEFYEAFLAECRKVRIFSKDCYIPLAINIYCKIGEKMKDTDMELLAIACLSLSAKLQDNRFYIEKLRNHNHISKNLCKIEATVLEKSGYDLWSTTALSYLEIILPFHEDILEYYTQKLVTFLLRGIWTAPYEMALKTIQK